MSQVKDNENKFSVGNEGIEKDLIQKSSNNQYLDPFKKKGIFGEIWSNKTKRYIAITITSIFVITIIIVIIAVAASNDSKTDIFPNNDSNNTDKTDSDKTDSDKTDSDKTDSDKTESDQTESDQTESDQKESDQTESDKTESDQKESDSTDTEFIKPDCSDACENPYDILVYSDEALKSKLKECGLDKDSELLKFYLSSIKSHNIFRACHNAPPLIFNCEIMKISQNYAKYLSDNDLFINSKNKYYGEKLGENLAKYGGVHSGMYQGESYTNMWYRTKSSYNFRYPSYHYNARQFTQVVWKNSTEFGIGIYCHPKTNNECHIVANYYPTGNNGTEEDYAFNVQNLQ